MIDKMSGKVAYAVISYGGFLGMGEDHYPTPWSNLKYDTNLGGYLVNLTRTSFRRRRNMPTRTIGSGRAKTTSVCTITTAPTRIGRRKTKPRPCAGVFVARLRKLSA
jgi:hypothetical protein